MIRLAKLALLLMLVAFALGTASADTWNYGADFSTSSPTFHDWSTGSKTLATGAFTPYAPPYIIFGSTLGGWWNGGWTYGAAIYNSSSTDPYLIDPLGAGLHTGDNPAYECTVRWTSPTDQVVYVDVFFHGQSAEPTTCFAKVYRNNALKFNGSIRGYYGTYPGRTDATTLTAGDVNNLTFQRYFWAPAGTTIDFGEAPNGKWTGNCLQVDAVITTATGYAVIEGVVRSAATSAPLVGATVQSSTGGYSDVTDSTGKYCIAVPANQTFSLTASFSGYYDKTQSVTAGAQNTITTKDFDLASGQISGFVRDDAGTPLKNAKVQVIGGPSATTGPDGSYTIYLTAGIYDVKASHGGYVSQQVSVDASSGTATQDFALAKLTSFSYADDFSFTDNPNGVWTLGYRYQFGDFVAFNTWTQDGGYPTISNWSLNGDWGPGTCWKYTGTEILVLGPQSWNPDQAFMLAGQGGTPYKVTVQFTVPYDATFRVNSRFTGQDNTTTGVYVRRNNENVATGYIAGNIGWPPDYTARYGDYEFNYSGIIAGVEGETIEFVIDAGGNGGANDLTGLDATVDVLPSDRSAIFGAVKANNTGFPAIANATVKVVGTGLQATTSSGGIFGFELDPGTYTIEVTKDNFQPLTQIVTVAAGETKTVDFVMEYLSGKTYYVKPDGDDTKDGLTLATAWATIDNGDRTGALVPGSTVMVYPGSYGSRVASGYAAAQLTSCPGKPGLPITYRAVGKAVLALPLNIFVTDVGFRLQGANMHDIVIDGFEVSGGARGFVIEAGGNITVRNCYVHDTKGYADVFPCTAAFYVTSSNNVIENCVVANNRLERPSGGVQGWFGAAAIYDMGGSNNVYRNNDFYVQGHDQDKGDAGCFVHLRDSSNIKLYNNTMCSGGSGIRIWSGSTAVEVKDNVLVNLLEYGLINEAAAGELVNSHNFFNNIGLGDYSGNASAGAGDISGQDPVFVNEPYHNHHLLLGSPAIDHGTNVGVPYVGSAPDMGAYESNGTGRVVASSIGELKGLPAYTAVQISGQVATADAGSVPNFIGDSYYDFISRLYQNLNASYIEEPTRYAGIKLLMPADMYLYKGDSATLAGDVALDANGEKVLRVSEMTDVTQQTSPAALGTVGRAFAGPGSDVTGLVVKVWGKVTYLNLDPIAGAYGVYVDDGTGYDDGTGTAIGIRALPPINLGDMAMVQVGDYISVTGVASHENAGGKIIPVIRMRDMEDTSIFQSVQPQ